MRLSFWAVPRAGELFSGLAGGVSDWRRFRAGWLVWRASEAVRRSDQAYEVGPQAGQAILAIETDIEHIGALTDDLTVLVQPRR